MITIKASGSNKKMDDFIRKLTKPAFFNILDHYGAIGVSALSSATPVDSGLTASSWTHEVTHKRGKHSIVWRNTNVNDGIPVAILIQYGHGTGTGGFVHGVDYINPAIQPLFQKIADTVWEQVTNG